MNRTRAAGIFGPILLLLSLAACAPSLDERVAILTEWEYKTGGVKSSALDFNSGDWRTVELPRNLSNLPELADYQGWLILRHAIPDALNRKLLDGAPLALNAGRVLDVSRYYLNGRLFGSLGQAQPFGEYAAAAMRPFRKNIPVAELRQDEANYIVIAIYSNGLYPLQFMDPVEVGPADAVFERYTEREVAAFAFLTLYAVAALYHLLLFIRRPAEKYNLYFALFGFATAAYWFIANTSMRDEVFSEYVLTHRKLEHMVLFLLPAFFVNFLSQFFHRRHTRFGVAYGFFCLAVVLITAAGPLWLMRMCRDAWYVSLVPVAGYCVWYLIRESSKGNRDARHLIAGLALLIAGVVNDILASLGLIFTPRVYNFAFLGFVGAMTYGLVRRYVNSHIKAEQLSADLEAKVIERTRDLEQSRQDAEASRLQADNARLHAESAHSQAVRAHDEIQKLDEFTRELNESTDLDTILKKVFQQMLFLFELDLVWLLLVDKKTGEVYTTHSSFAFASAYPPETTEFMSNFRCELKPGLSFYRTFERRKPTYLTRLNPDSMGTVDREIVERLGLKGFIHAPLIVQDDVIGILTCTRQRPGDMIISHDDREAIYRFAEHIGGAVYSSNLLEQVEIERQKSDQLLRNILPETVAEELKEHGRVQPMIYESVSVMFTDFVGFTTIAESMAPDDLLEELDGCFTQFDDVVAHQGMEKLKTIGDAYMSCGGLPTPNKTHAIDACLAALEFQAFMNQMREIKSSLNLPFWQLRLGIHSGPVMAGVVGKNKFAYDIWGDTVNTASRMESSGAAGRVNISGATYEMVKYFFSCEHRGKVQAKGKGEMDMYFLNGLRPPLARDKEGRIPNDEFYRLYEKIKAGAKLRFKAKKTN
ncbi:MAG: GAF domain-containing protein [bacterium]|nr:GAF domain-containing protein [bacterium]